MRRRPRGGLHAVLLVLLAGRLEAQTGLTASEIEGTVRNEAGAPLEGVTVEVTEAATGLVRAATTDGEGRYVVAGLPPGTYGLRVEPPGYRALVQDALPAGVGQTLRVDVTLAMAFAETVSVERQHDSASAGAVSAVVGHSPIEGLPTNGRDYVAFTLLTPGVVTERTPPTGPTSSSGLSFAGQRARSNHVMVDGFDNDEVFAGAVAASFSEDAVLEFQVLAASAPAEFGHASGGTVNTVTKAGTNAVHGGAWFYLRDDCLNSKGHFENYDVFGEPIDAPKAPFHQTQWGATASGPLQRDRTFFFLSYERLEAEASNFVTIAPDVAAALEGAGFPVELGNVPYSSGRDSALLRLDHNSSPEHRFLFRAHLSHFNNENAQPFGGIVARSQGVDQRRTDWGLALGRTDVFASGWLSEARLQVVRGVQTVRSLDPRCGGPCDDVHEGGPEVTLLGLAVAGRQLNSPQDRTNLDAQLAYTATRVRGSHTAKAGFDLDVTWRDGVLAQDFGGRYVFTALSPVPGLVPRPLTALEAFEQGLPALYFQGYGDPAASGTSSTFSFFAQDEWRISRRLGLAAGLRYQRYDLGLPTVTVSAPGGASLSYDVPSRGDLAPRVSLSLDPTGRGTTSLRAAFGVYYEDPLLAVALVTQIVNGRGLRLLQAGLPFSADAWRAPDHRLPEPMSSFPSVVQAAGPGFRAPHSHQITAGLTQELTHDLRLSLDFVATRGDDQIGVVDYNPLVPALGPGRRPDDVSAQPRTSASVYQFTNYGEGTYRGLFVSLRKSLSHGFEALASYTLSKAEDMGSDMFGQSNLAEDPGFGRDAKDVAGFPVGFAPASFLGPSAVDQRHRFVLSALGRLPWGLELSGILTVGSGRPYTALSGVDSNGDGIAATDRARRDPTDPASRVGRNQERLPATATVDARLSRRFALPRATTLEVLVEAFNLLDRTNYSDVNNVFGAGAFPDDPQRDSAGRVTYGRYTKAYAPRQVQLAARLTF